MVGLFSCTNDFSSVTLVPYLQDNYPAVYVRRPWRSGELMTKCFVSLEDRQSSNDNNSECFKYFILASHCFKHSKSVSQAIFPTTP